MAMTIVRGSDLAKCLQRSPPPTAPSLSASWDIASSPADSSQSSQTPSGDGLIVADLFDEWFVWVMKQCFQADSDVEAVVTTIQKRFGPMKVYLTGDEKSEESLDFFQVFCFAMLHVATGTSVTLFDF